MAKSQHNDFTTIYQASGMSPVRMVNIVAGAFCLGGLGMAYNLYCAPRLTAISSNNKLVWVGLLAALAVAAPIVAFLHGRRLAARLLLRGDGKVLRICEPHLFGTSKRDVAVTDLDIEGLQPGDPAGEKALSASRLQVAVRGGRNFIVSL
ncbi:MAG: hypothetical protein EOO40_02670, partial [Deltaproteobacteria bacterium]